MARILVHFPGTRYKKSEEKCTEKYCRNRRAKNRTLCSKHRSRWFKKMHPMRYHFNLLRCGARRRGIEFTLTFERYEQLAKESDLQNNRGHAASSLSVDRIDPNKGYTDDNIRICTISENSAKCNRMAWCPWFNKDFIDTNAVGGDEEAVEESNIPF